TPFRVAWNDKLAGLGQYVRDLTNDAYGLATGDAASWAGFKQALADGPYGHAAAWAARWWSGDLNAQREAMEIVGSGIRGISGDWGRAAADSFVRGEWAQAVADFAIGRDTRQKLQEAKTPEAAADFLFHGAMMYGLYKYTEVLLPGSPGARTMPQRPGVVPAERPGVVPAERPGVVPAERPGVVPAGRPGVVPAERPAVVPAE